MWQIIRKDIEHHARAITLFGLSAIALPSIFTMVYGRSINRIGYLGVVFGYIVIGAPALFALWFIGQEKVKGTFKLLSILPTPGRTIIVAKGIGCLAFCLLVVNLAAVAAPLIIGSVTGENLLYGFSMVLWINLLTALCASIDVMIFTLLESKVASQVIYLGHAFFALSAAAASRLLLPGADPENMISRLNNIGFKYWGVLLVLLICFALIDFSGRIFETKEWSDLEEN